jgi:hypothetical protein
MKTGKSQFVTVPYVMEMADLFPVTGRVEHESDRMGTNTGGQAASGTLGSP